MTGAGREFYIGSIEVDDVPGAAVYPTREEAP
jgi:hypothetical protein